MAQVPEGCRTPLEVSIEMSAQLIVGPAPTATMRDTSANAYWDSALCVRLAFLTSSVARECLLYLYVPSRRGASGGVFRAWEQMTRSDRLERRQFGDFWTYVHGLEVTRLVRKW